MDFKARALKIGFKDKNRFDAQAVKDALKAQRFANVELQSGPS